MLRRASYERGLTARPHVVHVVLSLNIGGLERNVVNQVREGQKLGQRITVICLDELGTLAPQVESLGARIVALDRRPGLRPGMVMSVKRTLRQLRPDVVHTHQLATLLYGGAAARLLRIPAILHSEHTQEAYATRMRTRLLGRLAASFCDLFYCLSEDMARQLRSARIVRERKLRVIRNGIDISKFVDSSTDPLVTRRSLGISSDAPVIGTVARLNEVKRQDVLLRAFGKVRQRFGNAHLVLVGDGPSRDDLRNLAASLGLSDRVHFTGYQPHSAPYLKAMDVFALTSRSEGMPQAALEASVMGLPVVASRVGGLPELIEHGVSGILFDPGNDASLADTFCDLIASPEKRRRMGAAARARVESSFSVGRMASEYHRDILELLRHEPRRVRYQVWHSPRFAVEDRR